MDLRDDLDVQDLFSQWIPVISTVLLFGARVFYILYATLGACSFLPGARGRHFDCGKVISQPGMTRLEKKPCSRVARIVASLETRLLRVLCSARLMDQISKSYFTHFYIAGILVSGCVLCKLLTWGFRNEGLRTMFTTPALFAETLIFFQSLRRLLECLYVSRPTKFSRMLVLHYFIGIAYYTITPLTPIIEDHKAFTDNKPQVALALFIGFSILQHKTHKDLASLRQKQTSKITLRNSHRLPKGRLFRICLCPAYFCEMGIYLSIALASNSTFTMLPALNLLSVTLGLMVLSKKQLQWLQRRFPGQLSCNQKAVIPYIY